MRIRKPLLLSLLALFSGFVVWELFSQKHDDSEMDRSLSVLLDVADAEIPYFTRLVSVVEPDVEKRDFSLIISGEENDVEWTSRTPAARRVRRITPDPALLNPDPILQKGDMLELALFDDVMLSAKISAVTRYPNGAVGITAHLQGDDEGIAYLSYSGGELRASIEMRGSDDYYVRYNPETGSHYAVQVDLENSDYQEGGEPRVPSDDLAADEPPPAPEGDDPVAQGDIPEGLPVGTVEVDVMVVYTPAARVAEGGTNGINNNIALAMEKAHAAHSNSDTRVYLNLVHSQETTYTEDGDPNVDLDRLTFIGGMNSAMDEVHTWRNTYGADMVCLLEDEPNTGGLGWLLTSEYGRSDRAFCLARVQQSDWTYTVVHEWGHNMGCAHSATQTSQPGGNGLYSYSSGWQWDDTASSYDGYCSVMTYENFDGVGGNEYSRVGHFSNPDISYIGDSTNATGHATDADNAQSIRNIRYVLVDYRINPAPISQFPYSNSFENAFTDWVYYEGSASWDREDGTDVNVVNNAPNIATTNAADGDIFLMTDGAQGVGETALLEAIFDFSELSSANFKFSYCMYSVWGFEGVNTLEASTNSGSTWATLWSDSGNPNNSWYEADINLDAYAGLSDVTLRFTAVMGSTWYKNYMCLDAFSVTGVVVNLDIDSDGLPNDWETLYYGGATNADPNATCSNGVNTLLEAYVAGLNPTNPASVFVMTQLGSDNGDLDRYVLQWGMVSGRVYSIYWASNLLTGFDVTPIATNIADGAFTDTVHGADVDGFYRIEVELAP